MSRARPGSLVYQVNRLFAAAHAIGASKRAARQAGAWQDRVFALRTDWNYRDATLLYARWVRARYGCHDVALAVQRPEWGRAWDAELARRGKAASTRKSYLSGVAKACAIVAPDQRAAWAEVIAAVGRRTPPPPRGYGDRAEALVALVGQLLPEAGLVLAVVLDTGARIGELVPTLRTGDHHLHADQLLGGNQLLLVGKGGLERVQHVSDSLYGELAQRAAGRTDDGAIFSVTDRAVQQALRRACRELGLRPAGPHGLRYDFATRLHRRLREAGWSLDQADREVSRQLGHRRAEITHHYLRSV